MFLKRLEIQGFKSFAKKTTLEFQPGLTAIVGPNGSGKSNVADSLRWVLGEQSSKLLRGKKSEDVIFAGSDKKVRLAFAEVVATFDNSDHKIPLDSAEVSIGRRVDRSGESQYLLNGNVVRLLDVVDLVLKSNIGTSRYTVIGQGTIDQMILAGPAEVKGLLDEASGVKTYYIKREKTLRRLEQTAQNLMRAEDLIAELEPRYKSLKRQAKRMEARSEVEHELKELQSQFYGARFWQLKTLTTKLEGELGGLQREKVALEKQAEEFRNKLESFERGKGESHGQYAKIQDELQSIQREKNALLESLSLVRGKLKSQTISGDKAGLELKAKQLGGLQTETQNNLEILEDQLKGLETEKARITSDLSQLEQRLSELHTLLNQPDLVTHWPKISEQISVLEHEFDKFFNRLALSLSVEEIKGIAFGLKSAVESLKSLASQIHGQESEASSLKLQEELDAVVAKKESLVASLHKFELKISRLEVEASFLKRELSRVQQELLHNKIELQGASGASRAEVEKELIAEENRLNNEVNRLSQTLDEISKRIELYHETLEQTQNERSQAEKNFRKKEEEISKLKDQQTTLEVQQAKHTTELHLLEQEILQELGLELTEQLKSKEQQEFDPGSVDKITKLKHQLSLTGAVDELTMQEFAETEARYTNLTSQVSDLKKGVTDLRQILDELDEHIKVKFNEAFYKINEKFEYYFKLLFNGGRAHLSLLKETKEEVAELEEAEGEKKDTELRDEEKVVAKYEAGATNIVGIDIRATPPGKKLASIQALSGGERALTSIALLCSLLTCFPSPFVVLDEVDAALDEANTIRFGQILGTLSNQTQFITITHNRETMAASNILYGVTMGDDGISRLLSIKLEQAKAYAK